MISSALKGRHQPSPHVKTILLTLLVRFVRYPVRHENAKHMQYPERHPMHKIVRRPTLQCRAQAVDDDIYRVHIIGVNRVAWLVLVG